MANKNLLDFPTATIINDNDFIHISQAGVDKKIKAEDALNITGTSGTAKVYNFQAGVDYVMGVTSALVVPQEVYSNRAASIYFDGVYQEKHTYSVSVSSFVFSSPIMSSEVEIVIPNVVDIGATSADMVGFETSNVDVALKERVKTVNSFLDLSTTSAEVGQVISLFCHTTPGYGGGDFDVVSSLGLAADSYNIAINDDIAFVRKTFGEVTPVLFGAKGKGDINEITSFDQCLNANIRQNHNGAKFLLDLSSHQGVAAPQITTKWSYITNSNVIAFAKEYALGSPGNITYYSVWGSSGEASLVFNSNFDGNNTFDYLPYQPAGNNAWCIPIYLHDSFGQKAIANSLVDGGGHAIEGANTDNLIVGLNTAKRHNGIGATNSDGFVLIGNSSTNTTDSHYFVNTCQFGAAIGNVGFQNNGGGGIDLAGAKDFVAVANSMSGGSANGIWPLKSPNTAQEYERVLISSNNLYNNCNYPNNEQGELQIGDYNNLSEYQGANVAAIGNLLSPRDTPSGSGFNPSVWVHGNTDNTAVLCNVFNPDAALVAGSRPSIVDLGSKSPVYAYNVKCGLDNTYLYFSAAPDDNSVFYGNIGMRVHPLSVAVPKTMRSQDGIWEYHIVRKLTKVGKNILEISYSGAFTYDVIDITLTSRNTNGVIRRRIVTQGTSGTPVTILENVAVSSFGPNPPVISLDVATNGILKINANIAAAGADNEDTSCHITITTASDIPTRFTPKFV